jgi:hypothetical protein
MYGRVSNPPLLKKFLIATPAELRSRIRKKQKKE